MQVEYKKEWMDTYLWILPDNRKEENYVEQMLKHNQGEGRLEFSKQEKDGEEYFCYKITGKKALNSIYAVMSIGERQIKGILRQLFDALENAREYLLNEEDFVLAPNYIFATFPQMDLEFCYVPGYGVPLKEQLENLFEYLLNRVDYDDKQAVSLLYDCYMFCIKESGGLAEIKKLLESKEEEMDNPAEKGRSIVTERKEKKPEQTRESLAIESVPGKKVIYPTGGGQKKDASYINWLTDHLFHRFKKEPAMVAEEKEEYCAVSVKGRKQSKKGGRQEINPGQSTALLKKESEEPWTMEEMEPTVLLSAVKESEELELICEKTGEVIPLTKFPFYIGSAKEYSDYVLPGEGVSRIHCCISKKLDNYYLSDLNSTNGTYLNQKEVIPGKKELLSANDEIRIVSQDFYVKFPCH